MVILYAARHDRPVPRLARWMLALGILASLAVNVAQGWSHGLAGAVVAAWPAVSLVGSYELLAWIIRTAAAGGPDHVPAADHHRPLADQARTGPGPAPGPAADAGPVSRYEQVIGLAPATGDSSQFPASSAVAGPRTRADGSVPDHPIRAADHPTTRITRRTMRTRFPARRLRLVPAARRSRPLLPRWPSTVPASGTASRYPSASSRRCSARPPAAGRTAGWSKPGRAPHRSERRLLRPEYEAPPARPPRGFVSPHTPPHHACQPSGSTPCARWRAAPVLR